MFIIANEFSNYIAFNQQQIIDNNIQFLKYNSSNKSNINKSLLQCNSKMLINKDDVLINNKSIITNSYTLKRNKVH